jgi:nitrogen fixation protein NifB
MPGDVIPLSGLANAPPTTPSAGCTAGACGAKAGQDATPESIWRKVRDHPCYSEEAHHFFARMHVAVAPACNIQCNYCNRKYDCANESRPGVTSERLTPEQAADKVMAVAARLPQLSVLGIAGPGDSMFDAPKTFATFARVEKRLPGLKFCISTNGLALPDHIDSLVRHNIDHVTLTINMIDPEIGQRIHPWVYFRGRRYGGIAAARLLHERQMESLELLVARGILVKVNSVMIPGINDRHLIEVNAAIKAKGAFLHNVLPLISDPAHGTAYGLAGLAGPTPQELADLQERLAGGANLMRHCRQCRADAVGLLGEDLSQSFTLDKIDAVDALDEEPRRRYREVVERERADRAQAQAKAGAALAKAQPPAVSQAPPRRRVAVCTKGGGRINQHFGHAREFQVYEVDPDGVRLLGHRKVDAYCQGGYGDDDALPTVLAALTGINVLFTAKIGRCPKADLERAGIEAVDGYPFEYIETALAAWYAERVGRVAACA